MERDGVINWRGAELLNGEGRSYELERDGVNKWRGRSIELERGGVMNWRGEEL